MKLNKKTILREMIVFKEDDDYVAKHPDWDYVVGVGETAEEAIQIFKEMAKSQGVSAGVLIEQFLVEKYNFKLL